MRWGDAPQYDRMGCPEVEGRIERDGVRIAWVDLSAEGGPQWPAKRPEGALRLRVVGQEPGGRRHLLLLEEIE